MVVYFLSYAMQSILIKPCQIFYLRNKYIIRCYRKIYTKEMGLPGKKKIGAVEIFPILRIQFEEKD